MRAALLLVVAACSGGQAPASTVSNVAPPSPDAGVSSNPPDMLDHHACEPIVRCGVWTSCVWLDHVDDAHYRADDETFVRRRECATDASGAESCAEHCVAGRCYDGLHPLDETCTGAAFPSRNVVSCRLGDGVCLSLL